MDNMELAQEYDDEQQSESVQQEGMPGNLMLHNINNNARQNEFYENKRQLLELGQKNNVNGDFQSHSPYKIIRYETPDLPSSEVNDPLCDLNEDEETLNRCNQPEFSSFSSPSSCLTLSENSAVIPKDDIRNNYHEETDKNDLNISGYTLMFSDEARDTGLISATPMVTNNNGQVENIFVLSLPPGVSAVLSDQPSEAEENNILITTSEIEHELEGVNNNTSSPSTSPYRPISWSSSTQHVTRNTTTNNHSLVTNKHKKFIDLDDGNRIRKSPRIEPNRVKFSGQVTPDGYILNPAVDQNRVHPSTRNAFSSLTNDELLDHRRSNSTNLGMENWHKCTDDNKENTPTSVRNRIQGFRPLPNQTLIGSQISSTPHPKYDQMTFCRTGLISQHLIKKEDVKPCPSNYFQSLDANSTANVNQKNNSLLCLKPNLANIKESDEARHLHNLNERKRRARIIIACNLMRKLVPGLSDKTDRATVFEYAARYIHFLNAQVGKEYETDKIERLKDTKWRLLNFLVKYSNY